MMPVHLRFGILAGVIARLWGSMPGQPMEAVT